MARETVEKAIEALVVAIHEDNHSCEIHVEDLGNHKVASFYLDQCKEEGGLPIACIAITPSPKRR